MTHSKASLDVAMSAGMMTLMVSIDQRLKRQTLAVAATMAAIEEVKRGIKAIDDEQMKLDLDKAPADPAPAKRK